MKSEGTYKDNFAFFHVLTSNCCKNREKGN